MKVRTTVLRLTGLALLAAVLLSGLVALGIRWIGEADGERTAERASSQVAASVLDQLARRDFTEGANLNRQALLADLEPFLQSGMVYRVKVWSVTEHHAQIAFSDESRVESAVRPFDPHLARRLDAGEAVVESVPNDNEHRFEIARAGDLREVFIGFRDAAGTPARLEVYVSVDVDTTVRHATTVLLPLTVVGVLAVALALFPLAVGVARRIDRDRRERDDALHYGFAAAELARRDVAHKLHDHVIPDLASAGLLLDIAADVPPPRAKELVSDARARIGADVHRLRGLLSELTPPMLDPAGVRTAFVGLVAGLANSGCRITLEMADDPHLEAEVASLLHRAAGELLRNAVTHSGASHVHLAIRRDGDRVHAVVADNGRGFNPAAPAESGHIGLLLVRRAVADAGGTFTISSARGRDRHEGTGSYVELVVPGTVSYVQSAVSPRLR
ncbi:sensor histidine kinase [Pseudonocardia sp. MH-G8]|uniref:sensor histidine kinase n=1 Tax=Pseudonocardia sp. MH-G8 TaxID=1854588 RepID=UPI000BA0B121|nr:ATP-binding protein [Pseudonocardia sp. MH-G8]OZM79936.1 hypothetical protein CFP66_23325 [Pseudonocardia sp. MH-G8]